VINLGGDRPVTLWSVIEQISEMLGRRAEIERRPIHPADVPATWADVAKARQLIGWTPQVSVEEGLRRSVQWYRDHRDVALPLVLGDV
jgi:nucleoside-diphosphate-sugar epimerase